MSQHLYAIIGRKQEAYETLLTEYRNLLQLVSRIKSGEVDPQLVDILPNDAWLIRPPAEDAKCPATLEI